MAVTRITSSTVGSRSSASTAIWRSGERRGHPPVGSSGVLGFGYLWRQINESRRH